MKQEKRTKTRAQVRAEFAANRTSIAAWAQQHKLNPNLVYDILSGHTKRRCLRGQSLRAAVLLKLAPSEFA